MRGCTSKITFLLVAFLTTSCAASTNPTSPSPGGNTIPPRLLLRSEILGENRGRENVQLSPDGKYLSWLAYPDNAPASGPSRGLFIAPLDDLSAAKEYFSGPDSNQPIQEYRWSYESGVILLDLGGGHFTRALDVRTGRYWDITVKAAKLLAMSSKYPHDAVYEVRPEANSRVLWRQELLGKKSQFFLECKRFSTLALDEDFSIRAATIKKSDGSVECYFPDGDDWRLYDTISPEDARTTRVIGFAADGKHIYIIGSHGRDTTAVVEIDLASDDKRILAADDQSDVCDVLLSPIDGHVQAAAFNFERKRWKVIDPNIQADFDILGKLADGDIDIISRTLDDRLWLVRLSVSDGPALFYLYDHPSQKARLLFKQRDDLDGLPLVKVHSATVTARDGLRFPVYYSVPAGADRPVPLVIIAHPGPWDREVWEYNNWLQWLANRGYAGLVVNFRSSTGFGKKFLHAGDKQWGGDVLNDILDARQWAIDRKIADPNRVALMGASFGGYITLAGLAFAPDKFACGVDMYGPSDLVSLLDSFGPSEKAGFEQFARQVGDPRTEAGLALLKKYSPSYHLENIHQPVLMMQGGKDQRCRQKDADALAANLDKQGTSVTYVLFPHAGHEIGGQANSNAFHAIADIFFAQHLGGRCDSDFRDDLKGADMLVPVGSERIPGLVEAIKR